MEPRRPNLGPGFINHASFFTHQGVTLPYVKLSRKSTQKGNFGALLTAQGTRRAERHGTSAEARLAHTKEPVEKVINCSKREIWASWLVVVT